jgi:hypothetical protein
MSNHFDDLYSRELNKGKLLSKVILYEFQHITKNGQMHVTMNACCQLHQEKTFLSGQNGCYRVDVLSQSRQRH